MSWSIYTAGLPAAIDDRIDALEPPYTGEPEREEQIKAAKAAAKSLIESGALGSGPAFSVTLNGHANPDHQATTVFGADTIGVGVRQTTEQEVTQFDAAQAQAEANAQ